MQYLLMKTRDSINYDINSQYQTFQQKTINYPMWIFQCHVSFQGCIINYHQASIIHLLTWFDVDFQIFLHYVITHLMYTLTSSNGAFHHRKFPPKTLQVLWGHGCVVLEIEHRSDNMKDPETTGMLFFQNGGPVGLISWAGGG